MSVFKVNRPGKLGRFNNGRKTHDVNNKLQETAQRNELELHTWLTEVLIRLPECSEEVFADLLHFKEVTVAKSLEEE